MAKFQVINLTLTKFQVTKKVVPWRSSRSWKTLTKFQDAKSLYLEVPGHGKPWQSSKSQKVCILTKFQVMKNLDEVQGRKKVIPWRSSRSWNLDEASGRKKVIPWQSSRSWNLDKVPGRKKVMPWRSSRSWNLDEVLGRKQVIPWRSSRSQKGSLTKFQVRKTLMKFQVPKKFVPWRNSRPWKTLTKFKVAKRLYVPWQSPW